MANQVNYFKIGGFNRYERVNKINRLIEIENFLKENELLGEQSSQMIEKVFSDFKLSDEITQQIQQIEENSVQTKKPTKQK